MVLDSSCAWILHICPLALHFCRGAAAIPLKIFAVQFTNSKTNLYITRKPVQESAGFGFGLELSACMLLNQLHYCGWFNYSIAHHVVEWIEKVTFDLGCWITLESTRFYPTWALATWLFIYLPTR